jgi:pyridoxamine 5'-phosphate oxidase
MREREQELRRDDLQADPFRQFDAWFDQARAEGLPLPQACALATASPDGRPSARMVLLKDASAAGGFVFATSYISRKGRDLAANARAALLFYWHALGRQVRVEGTVERVSPGESDAIFLARPRDSRISALASRQSERLETREVLEARVRELEAELEGREVERPDFWGGYRLVPDELEFWQHRENRLHIRFAYRREGDGWRVDELQP